MSLKKSIESFHKWSNSLIKDRFPLLSLFYYTKPVLYLHWRKQPIHALINSSHTPANTKTSILFFTVHKSASTLMTQVIQDLAGISGLTHIDYNGYFATQGLEGIKKQNEKHLIEKVFKPAGYIYGPLRNYLTIPNIDKYKVILLLRDPRDVLTSYYFSIRNSHPLITSRLIERRKQALSMTIDEHVKMEAGQFLETYTLYVENLLGKSNVLLLKYEDMIKDFPTFISKINSHLGLNISEEELKKLDRTKSFSVKKEDASSHIRKVASGDHKEKLKPETIEWLNKKFEIVLKKLGYGI